MPGLISFPPFLFLHVQDSLGLAPAAQHSFFHTHLDVTFPLTSATLFSACKYSLVCRVQKESYFGFSSLYLQCLRRLALSFRRGWQMSTRWELCLAWIRRNTCTIKSASVSPGSAPTRCTSTLALHNFAFFAFDCICWRHLNGAVSGPGFSPLTLRALLPGFRSLEVALFDFSTFFAKCR